MEEDIPALSLVDLVDAFGLPLWIAVLGGIISIVGGVWLLFNAFRQSIWWGLGSLFVPFVALIFVVMKWSVAKNPFLLNLAGGLFMLGSGIAMQRQMDPENPAVVKLMTYLEEDWQQQSGADSPTPAETEDIDPTHIEPLALPFANTEHMRREQEALNAINADIMARREALDPDDSYGLKKITREIHLYNTRLEHFRKRRDAME